MLAASCNNIDDYCYYMELAGLMMQLRDMGEKCVHSKRRH